MKTKKKHQRISLKLWGGIAVFCLISLGVGLAIFWQYTLMQSHKPAYTGPVEKIRTGYVGEYATLILIANEKGYFQKWGIDPALEAYPSGPETLTALLGGKLDVALASDFAGVRNSFNGEKLRILSTISRAEAFYMIGRKDLGITNDIASLKNKRVGITQKTVGEFYLGQFLTFNNLSTRDIQIVDMPQAALVEAVKSGSVDAAALFQPNAYKAQALLGDQAVTWPLQKNQSIYTQLYASDQLIEKRPDALKRYFHALVEAERYVKRNNADARAIIAKNFKYSNDYMNMAWPRFTFSLSLDEELLLNMDDEARWAIENKLTTATMVPNYLRMVYFDALEASKPEGITVIR